MLSPREQGRHVKSPAPFSALCNLSTRLLGSGSENTTPFEGISQQPAKTRAETARLNNRLPPFTPASDDMESATLVQSQPTPSTIFSSSLRSSSLRPLLSSLYASAKSSESVREKRTSLRPASRSAKGMDGKSERNHSRSREKFNAT